MREQDCVRQIENEAKVSVSAFERVYERGRVKEGERVCEIYCEQESTIECGSNRARLGSGVRERELKCTYVRVRERELKCLCERQSEKKFVCVCAKWSLLNE